MIWPDSQRSSTLHSHMKLMCVTLRVDLDEFSVVHKFTQALQRKLRRRIPVKNKTSKVKQTVIPVTPKQVGVRFQLPYQHYRAERSSTSSTISMSSLESRHSRHTTHPRVEPRLHTPRNPNRCLPDHPLGMSLRMQKMLEGGSGGGSGSGSG